MLVEVTINRGTINVISDADIRSGNSGVLTSGTHKILFDSPFSDADYDLVINCFDASGLRSGFEKGLEEADGFTVTLGFDSIITYIVNKTS